MEVRLKFAFLKNNLMYQQIKCVLLIDDDTINNFIVSNTLVQLAISEKLEICVDGEEAIQYLKERINNPEELPEIIFLDINMPVMDGWEFLNEFEKFFPSIKKRIDVYMVSSSVYHDDIIRSRGYSFIKEFISKPLTKEKLSGIHSAYFAS